jgi:hypothetical protein
VRPYPLNTLRLKAFPPDGEFGRHRRRPALREKIERVLDTAGEVAHLLCDEVELLPHNWTPPQREGSA